MKIKNARVISKIAFVILGMMSTTHAETNTESKSVPVTVSATNITQTSALLTGTFTSDAQLASMGWNAPRIPNSGANCGPLSINPLTQSCTASGLTCNTKYRYIATEITQKGPMKGKDLFFTTAKCN